jgi:hypothetical protein
VHMISIPHECGMVTELHSSPTGPSMEADLERDDFSSRRHPARTLSEHDLFPKTGIHFSGIML